MDQRQKLFFWPDLLVVLVGLMIVGERLFDSQKAPTALEKVYSWAVTFDEVKFPYLAGRDLRRQLLDCRQCGVQGCLLRSGLRMEPGS